MLFRTLLPFALAATVSAQSEILHYKFEGGGAKALNYALNSPAPGEGPITNTLTTAPLESFVPGPFGMALQGGAATQPYQAVVVDTGWSPNVTGDYTWAMWLNNSRGNPGPGLTYVAGIPVSGSFRIYGGSSTLLTVGGAGGTTYYRTTANVYQLASAGWVHVAFVVDTVAATTTYYINGVAEAPVALTGAVNITGPTFTIGRQLPTSAPSIYDIDEFRFLTRTATPAEILGWASVNPAGLSTFGQGCDATMTAGNGLPQLGNVLFRMDVQAAAGGVGFMVLGFSRTTFGALALPVDLGSVFAGMTGCPWEVSNDALILTPLSPVNTASLGFPIPPVPQYDGTEIFAQGLFIGGPRGLMSTNPMAIAIGN